MVIELFALFLIENINVSCFNVFFRNSINFFRCSVALCEMYICTAFCLAVFFPNCYSGGVTVKSMSFVLRELASIALNPELANTNI